MRTGRISEGACINRESTARNECAGSTKCGWQAITRKYGRYRGREASNIVTELKIRYENRIPELLENLFVLAEPDKPYMVQIAATKEILDRLIGKAQVTIEATHTTVSVADLYKAAMMRANAGNRADAKVVVGNSVGKADDTTETPIKSKAEGG
jgi:hypothetical protein